MLKKYILNKDHSIKVCEDTLTWGKFMEQDDRFVRTDTIITLSGYVRISTVFLGIDHDFTRIQNHPPVLFETMIFGGEYDQAQARYCTWEAAVAGHAVAVAKVRHNPKN